MTALDTITRHLLARIDRYHARFEQTGDVKYARLAVDADRRYRELRERVTA